MQMASGTSFTLPNVVHEPVHKVRQRPALRDNDWCRLLHSIAVRSVHNAAPGQTTALHTHGCERTTARRTTRPWGRRSLRNSRADFRATSRTPNRNSAHLLLHILPSAGIYRRGPLMRTVAHRGAHGGARRPYNFNHGRVSPCHPSCSSPRAQLGNTLRLTTGSYADRCQTSARHGVAPLGRNARTSCAQPSLLLHGQPATAGATPARHCRATAGNTRTQCAHQTKQLLRHRNRNRRCTSVTTDLSFYGQNRGT